MLRYDPRSSDTIDFEFSRDEKGARSPLNTSTTSINSGISAGGLQSTASSSKAVLAALRALQDKIRRLEVEKTQALDDAAQLRSQLKSQEIETEHSKERDALQQQKSLQEARMRYEQVLAEKTDMESKLRQLEQHNHNLEDELESVKAKNRSFEANHSSSADRLADLEDQISRLESDLQRSRQKEKDLSSAMVWETRRHDDEMRMLSDKLEAVNSDMSQSSVARVEKETKLVELDHLVGQLLAVNQTLVNQLSSSTGGSGTSRKIRSKSTSRATANSAGSTTTSKKKKSTKKSIVPRAAVTSTASIDAKVAATAERKRSKSLEAQRNGTAAAEASANADRLLGMHEMYVSLASTITGKKLGGKTKKSGRPVSGSASVSSSRSASSLGAGSSSNGRPKTRIRGRKMELGEPTSTSAGIMGIHHVDINYGGQPTKNLDDFESKYKLTASGDRHHHAPTSPTAAQTSAELQGVISSLEDEFNSLNTQYQELLSSADSVTGGHGSESQSRELVSVIQKLHKKGEQLRALKSPSKSP